MIKNDTIYAPATPAGGAIGIIRASGSGCAMAGEAIAGRPVADAPRKMRRVTLRDRAGRPFDDAMAVFFEGPRSYTGEDMLELYCHGGPMVLQQALTALGALGLRPAEPGEFTRRAFLNGKLDLSQAEAVMDLIGAQAAAGARAALHQLAGRLRDRILTLESELTDAQSAVAAAIDYPEEVEADVCAKLPETLQRVMEGLEALIAEGRAGRVLREGLGLCLIGRPNVGKSSLLNALLQRERAIVTATPGTTRDVLEEETDFSGVPVRLVDTAGLRDTGDEAEKIGVERAKEALTRADVALVLLDGSVPLTSEDRAIIAKTGSLPRILVKTKCDLQSPWDDAAANISAPCLPVSARTGEGLDQLRETALLAAGAGRLQDGPALITNERHIRALEEAQGCLKSAFTALKGPGLDCAGTDISEALHHLGAITGRDVDEAVLNRVFERFCVGK